MFLIISYNSIFTKRLESQILAIVNWKTGGEKKLFLFTLMEANIIKIGNSKGLILSKSILEQYNIHDKVKVILEKGRIILKPINKPRKNWEASFKQMRTENDDQLLIDDVFQEENY